MALLIFFLSLLFTCIQNVSNAPSRAKHLLEICRFFKCSCNRNQLVGLDIWMTRLFKDLNTPRCLWVLFNFFDMINNIVVFSSTEMDLSLGTYIEREKRMISFQVLVLQSRKRNCRNNLTCRRRKSTTHLTLDTLTKANEKFVMWRTSC